ncbi:MAG: hypothetical protein R3335_00545 [Anaerolineales bacterium]|nr:hypothetical protein [Anaerolineales bacterium]
MRRQHPFLSPTGVVLTAILFLVLAFLLWRTGGWIFNPGPLTAVSSTGESLGGVASHAEIAECGQCHRPLETRQSELCMQCHLDIRQEINDDGLHARIPDVARCFDCHPDHRGADFDPVLAAAENFDHEITGFSLIRHQINYDTAPLACIDCHAGGEFTANVAVCADCHGSQDQAFIIQHELDFGIQCLDCHDGVDRMIGFAHHTTGFPLDGEHAALACAGCHQDAPFDQTPSECAGCHSEPPVHLGMFGTDCAACHTPTGWTPASLDSLAFDHAENAGFDLDRHALDFRGNPISCSDCHTAGLQQFTEQTCLSCHEAEEPAFMAQHQDQFGPACVACHDGVDRMAGFNHQDVFLLDGRHAEIECAACHLDFQFSGTPLECSACHAEPAVHAGVFGTNCEACHTTTAWAPALLRAHTFPLDHGGEGVIECLTCHPATYVQYTCDACHAPAEMLEEHNKEEIFGISGRCAECHPTGLEDE